MNASAKALTEKSTADLRSAWRTALKKEVEERRAEIDELCRTYDLAALNTMLTDLIARESALPPLPLGFIRADCYACVLPIAGTSRISCTSVLTHAQGPLCAVRTDECSTSGVLCARNARLISLISAPPASPSMISITACLAERASSLWTLPRSLRPLRMSPRPHQRRRRPALQQRPPRPRLRPQAPPLTRPHLRATSATRLARVSSMHFRSCPLMSTRWTRRRRSSWQRSRRRRRA